MGPCAGGAVYSPAMTDFIFMVKDTSLHVRDRPGRGEDRDPRGCHRRGARRGGDATPRSGVADVAFDNDIEALLMCAGCSTSCRSTTATKPPLRADRRPGRPRRIVARHHHPRQREQALRHARGDHRRSSTTATSSRCRRSTPATSSSASSAWTAPPSASSPTSRWCSPAASTSDFDQGRRASSASATPSTFPSSPSSTCPASCRGVAQEYGGIIKHGAKLLFAYAEARCRRSR